MSAGAAAGSAPLALVTSTIRVTDAMERDDGTGGWRFTATVRLDGADPVFAGHFPGLPILPGVCVVECVHRAATANPPPGYGGLLLRAVERARFVGAAYPGDVLRMRLAWTVDGAHLRAGCQVGVARGETAVVRLRYGVATGTGGRR